MDKQILINLLERGLTNRQIAEELGKSKSTVNYWIHKYELVEKQKFHKLSNYTIGKINSKEKAYILGFLLADAYIKEEQVDVSIALADREVLDFIAKQLDARVRTNNTLDKSKRIFPHVRMSKKINGIKTLIGDSDLKEGRNFPRVSKEFRRYLLLGFFDGDGSLSWGERKDRNRIWQKISFTSSLSLLTGVQKLLMEEIEISSIVRPKSGENCFVLEFANKENVLKFLDYIYPNSDFIILQRKYLTSCALRLKLGEFGEG